MNQPRKPSPAILVAVLALVAALAGTAVAGTDATMSAISKKKVKKLIKKEVAKQIENATGPPGAPGSDGTDGTDGTDGADGADGTARAYAQVLPSCPGALPASCDLSRAKGVTGAIRVNTGRYCVTAPGIDPNAVPPAVTVDYTSTVGPEGNTSAMAAGGGCPAGDFAVNTDRHGAGTDADFANNVGFTIVIP